MWPQVNRSSRKVNTVFCQIFNNPSDGKDQKLMCNGKHDFRIRLFLNALQLALVKPVISSDKLFVKG